MKKLKKTVFILMSFLLIGNGTFAQWQTDSFYGFKINLPSTWSKSSYMDGSDKVYDYYSPDENAAIQLRVFQAGADITTDVLVQVYEENMLPAGSQKQSLKDHTTKNGIPGKQGIYIMDYNGTEVGMSAFYTVQNNKAYILTVIIPTSMMQQKGDEVKQITQSFIIDGFSPAATAATKVLTPNTGDQNRTGARPSTNQSSSHKLEIHGAHQAYDFIKARVVSLAESTGDGFSIYGACDGLPKAFGRFSVSTSSEFHLVTSWNVATLSKVDKWEAREVPINKVCVFLLDDGTIGKFRFVDQRKGEDQYGNCMRIITFEVEYPASTSTTQQNANSSGSGSLSGKYVKISRADGQDIWYEETITFHSDGTQISTMKARGDSGISSNPGTWELHGDLLTTKRRGGHYPQTFKVKDNLLYNTDSNGQIISTYQKQ